MFQRIIKFSIENKLVVGVFTGAERYHTYRNGISQYSRSKRAEEHQP